MNCCNEYGECKQGLGCPVREEHCHVKPEPKPDFVRYGNIQNAWYLDTRSSGNNIKLTFNGETGALKKAEVLK